jgi:hypothetical protein
VLAIGRESPNNRPGILWESAGNPLAIGPEIAEEFRWLCG